MLAEALEYSPRDTISIQRVIKMSKDILYLWNQLK